MNNFKILQVMMFICSIIHLHGASEETIIRRVSFAGEQNVVSTSAVAARSRTSSKEFMDRLIQSSQTRLSLPHIQLAETISAFQRSQFIVGIRKGSKNLQNPQSIARYVAALDCVDQLAEIRKNLEKIIDGSCPLDLIASVQNHINEYRNHTAKIDVVVSSSEFIAVERKCQEILSGHSL